MYSNSYGYGVYKRNQVNIGSPYKQKKYEPEPAIVKDIFDEVAATEDPEQDLKISQDIIHKARENAALIKREAELEAERILAEAEQEIDQLIAEAQQKAKEEGYRHGEELAQEHYNDLISEAMEFKEQSRKAYEETLTSLEQDIVELVLSIATKIVGDEMRNNKEVILGVVRETIVACSNRENIVLKVSPEDYEFVATNEEKLRLNIKGLNELEIRKDASLSKGSCIIDTDFGSVDGSCDVRLESIRKAFFELMGENGQ
ncbi:MAG: FliH/SctL family protein [Acetivibrionales bacterium]